MLQAPAKTNATLLLLVASSRLAELQSRKRFLLATTTETRPKLQELCMPVLRASTVLALPLLARLALLVPTKDRRQRVRVPRARLAATATVARHRAPQRPLADTCPFLAPQRRNPSARAIITHTLVNTKMHTLEKMRHETLTNFNKNIRYATLTHTLSTITHSHLRTNGMLHLCLR